MSSAESDRRAEPRLPMQRPCKIFDERSGRYVGGSTWNVSRNGALVELPFRMSLVPGSRIFIGLALKRREGVLRQAEMIEADVLRADPAEDDRMSVALRLRAPLVGELPHVRRIPLAA